MILVVLLLSSFSGPPHGLVCHGLVNDHHHKDNEKDPGQFHAADLFASPPEIRVVGPTEFPKPTDKLYQGGRHNRTTTTARPVVLVKPTYGQHRPDADAILAYAEGYKLPWYQMFLETLTSTGYRGDVVLAIAEPRIVSPHVVDYLQTFTVHNPDKPNVIVYQQELDCDNPSPSNTDYYGTNHRQLTKQGDTNPFQMCRLTHFYGWQYKDDNDNRVEPVADPRPGRVVATLRYEWYWIWSLQYEPQSWLMLLDARDSFFQTNPFVQVPRSNPNQPKTSGLLYLYGENAQATRLGISKKNQQWIRKAYGEATIQVLKDKPTICSGSTMGEQVAIESYLRAMVNEHDECHIKMMGADQGFHNVRMYYTDCRVWTRGGSTLWTRLCSCPVVLCCVSHTFVVSLYCCCRGLCPLLLVVCVEQYLYYSQKLTHATAIERIVVWEQGRGHINNLGALRTKELQEWGNLYNPETHQVFQWPIDNKNEPLVLSPVVHQWDRDKHLHSWMVRFKHKEWEREWLQQHPQQQQHPEKEEEEAVAV